VNPEEIRARLRELDEKRDGLLTQVADLRNAMSDGGTDGQREHLGRLNAGLRKLDDERAEATDTLRRLDVLMREAGNPDAMETPARNLAPQRRDTAQTPVEAARNDAMRALEIEVRADRVPAKAAERVEKVIGRDTTGIDARYVAAHAAPAYSTAFGKIISGRSAFELTPDEQDAVRMALEANRALTLGSTAGYGVPISLDPTIIPLGNGAANPLRELADVRTISTSEWAGVTSQGVTAAFAAEGTEASDDTPTLAQPTITPERAQAFVPFSIEAGQDWAGLQSELLGEFQRAKDTLEASKFTTGAGHGSHEPEGIVTGASNTVAAGTASYAVAHFYALQEALPPAYQANAVWLSSLALRNGAYRLVAEADTDEPSLFDASGNLLGKPWREASNMTTAKTTGSKIAIYGDVNAAFKIVDRIGLTVEIIPHLFGGSGRPTGQRGMYAIWRTSSKVVNANAIRLLQTT
jgi:HK97 family phage major capsid protein